MTIIIFSQRMANKYNNDDGFARIQFARKMNILPVFTYGTAEFALQAGIRESLAVTPKAETMPIFVDMDILSDPDFGKVIAEELPRYTKKLYLLHGRNDRIGLAPTGIDFVNTISWDDGSESVFHRILDVMYETYGDSVYQ